jgi:mannose-6-phosphate isomerase-like protein (cupin superfamily)
MKNPAEFSSTGSFNIAASLPETATTLLVDQYLTNRDAASGRVFRVYKPRPPHYHATCDEYLYVFSGRGTFWMMNPESQFEFHPAQFYSLKPEDGTPESFIQGQPNKVSHAVRASPSS